MAKNNFYVVWHGRTTGIFDSWEACKAQVDGFEGAQYKGFPTEEAAKKAASQNYWQVVNGNKSAQLHALFDSDEDLPKPEPVSLSVDAACSGNPGQMEYRGVWTDNGEEIFRMGPFEEATNNVGEFLAIVHGLAWLKKKNLVLPLYSDSVTAQAWVRQKKCKSQLEQTPKNRAVFELIERAEKWLIENSYETEILKWHTELWGEIPADFGRK
ncbi:MAG TPA: ribonuclease H family protein [Paludibacteraceae bacterium]|nr:ribonuclease H family protein [Paludibacteraceae bacterium]HRS67319.1 ribonuclease H family protein [Paludibacteraceae bacterium]